MPKYRNALPQLNGNLFLKSHAELDGATELDAGNPVELAQDYYKALKARLKNLNVVGGCCGTDYRHIEETGKVLC